MSTTASPTLDRIPLGVALMISFCALAPLIDVAAKFAAQHVSVGQVTFARLVVQSVLMVPVVMVMGQSFALPRALWGRVAFRALMLIGSTFAFVGAVQVMPIADALAIAFVEPFILLVLGALLFGDEVGPRRIAASVIGFVGCLLVIQPNFNAFGLVALYPLATAFFFAGYILVTRSLSRKMEPVAMQFHTAFVGALIMVPMLGFGGIAELPVLAITFDIPASVWGMLAAVGLAASVSHMAMTYALKFAPSATLAPLHYLEIVTAVLFGWMFFGDWPNLLSWAGICVISSAGLYIIARERALAKAVRAQGPR